MSSKPSWVSPLRPAPLLALVCAFYVLAWPTRTAFWDGVDFNAGAGAFDDFLNRYYWMGQRVFHDPRPVPGFVYSPFFAVLCGAFEGASATTAMRVWQAIEMLATVLVVLLPLRIVPPRSDALRDAYLATCLVSLPLVHAFHWGQVSVPLVAFVLASILADARGKRGLAAFLLAVPIAIKFYPALLLVVPLSRGDARGVAACAGWALVLGFGVPALVLGPTATATFYGDVLRAVDDARRSGGVWDLATNRQYFPAALARLVAGGVRVFDALQLAGFVAAAACGWVVLRLSDAGSAEHQPLAYSIALLALPLAVDPSWPHYFAYLPFCQLAVWRASRSSGRRPWRVLGPVAAGASAVLASTVMFRIVGDSAEYGRLGLLLFADLTLLVAALGLALATGPTIGTLTLPRSPAPLTPL